MWHDVKILPLMLSALKIESPEAKWSLWSGSISINFWMQNGAAYSRTSASGLQSSGWHGPCSSPISLRPGKRASQAKHHLVDLKRPLWSPSINIPNGETKLVSKKGWTAKKTASIELYYCTVLFQRRRERRIALLSFFHLHRCKILNWLKHSLMFLFLFSAIWTYDSELLELH